MTGQQPPEQREGNKAAAIREAAEDRRSGAAEIVRRAAEALAALPPRDIEEAVITLVRGQPSMAPLWRLGSEVLNSTDPSQAARDFAIRVAAERDQVARHAASLLTRPVVVHSYSSTLISTVIASGIEAFCARSEPGGEGRRTVERITNLGGEARLFEDAEALAAVDDAVTVLVGADAVDPEGIVNKVGTRRLAEAAHSTGSSCVVVAGESKLVNGHIPAPHPFERTPLELLTWIVTQDGPLSPAEAAGRAHDHPIHPLLAALLEELR
jgi:translation initiation factor 2B subunit (eIF-2B alpha/beta/delta family)